VYRHFGYVMMWPQLIFVWHSHIRLAVATRWNPTYNSTHSHVWKSWPHPITKTELTLILTLLMVP